MQSAVLYYLALIVERTTPRLEAGVDLLSGPYLTSSLAESHRRRVYREHPRRLWTAYLSPHIEDSDTPARIEVIRVSHGQVLRYNARHRCNVPWPPLCVLTEAAERAELERLANAKRVAKRAARKAARAQVAAVVRWYAEQIAAHLKS